MQSITIGVGRTRDMRTLRVYVQMRDTTSGRGLFSRHVGGVTYAHPFELTQEQARELGDVVLRKIEDLLAQPALPWD
jgi:hypothetical protein